MNSITKELFVRTMCLQGIKRYGSLSENYNRTLALAASVFLLGSLDAGSKCWLVFIYDGLLIRFATMESDIDPCLKGFTYSYFYLHFFEQF